MNFLLSLEQEQLFETVQRFAQEKADAGLRRRAFDGESDLDKDFWRELMALGVAGTAVPESAGGLGLEMIDLALIAEALGYAAAPGPFLSHVLAIQAIAAAGDESQRAEWLPPLLSGEMIAAIAIDDPDPEQWKPKFNKGRLMGGVRDVIGGATADVVVAGLAGGRFALAARSEKLTAVPLDGLDRSRRMADLRFDGAEAILLPGEGIADRIIDAALVLIAADAFGGASRCLDMACDYARTREQFGRIIARFQGLKFQLANMAVDVEPARGLYWYAAHAYDHAPDDRRRAAAAAKAHLGEVYMQAARDTIEAHGGIGYTWAHDVQIYFKRAMLDYAWLGTPAWHRRSQARFNRW